MENEPPNNEPGPVPGISHSQPIMARLANLLVQEYEDIVAQLNKMQSVAHYNHKTGLQWKELAEHETERRRQALVSLEFETAKVSAVTADIEKLMNKLQRMTDGWAKAEEEKKVLQEEKHHLAVWLEVARSREQQLEKDLLVASQRVVEKEDQLTVARQQLLAQGIEIGDRDLRIAKLEGHEDKTS